MSGFAHHHALLIFFMLGVALPILMLLGALALARWAKAVRSRPWLILPVFLFLAAVYAAAGLFTLKKDEARHAVLYGVLAVLWTFVGLFNWRRRRSLSPADKGTDGKGR